MSIRSTISFSLLSALLLTLAGCGTSEAPSKPTGSGAVISAQSSATSSGRFAYLRDAMYGSSASSVSSVASSSKSSVSSQRSTSSTGLIVIPSGSMVATTTTRPRTSSGVMIVSGTQGATRWSSEGEHLGISITPDRIEAYPTDEILYTIVVCNTTWDELRNVGVSFRFNMAEMRVIAISDNGRLIENIVAQKFIRYAPVRDSVSPTTDFPVAINGEFPEELRATSQKVGHVIAQAPSTFGRVDWVIERLGPGESKKLTVRVKLSDLLKQGDIVRTEAIANDTPRAGYDIVKAMSDARIIERIPDTGADLGGVDAGPSMEPPLPGQLQK